LRALSNTSAENFSPLPASWNKTLWVPGSTSLGIAQLLSFVAAWTETTEPKRTATELIAIRKYFFIFLYFFLYPAGQVVEVTTLETLPLTQVIFFATAFSGIATTVDSC